MNFKFYCLKSTMAIAPLIVGAVCVGSVYKLYKMWRHFKYETIEMRIDFERMWRQIERKHFEKSIIKKMFNQAKVLFFLLLNFPIKNYCWSEQGYPRVRN